MGFRLLTLTTTQLIAPEGREPLASDKRRGDYLGRRLSLWGRNSFRYQTPSLSRVEGFAGTIDTDWRDVAHACSKAKVLLSSQLPNPV